MLLRDAKHVFILKKNSIIWISTLLIKADIIKKSFNKKFILII